MEAQKDRTPANPHSIAKQHFLAFENWLILENIRVKIEITENYAETSENDLCDGFRWNRSLSHNYRLFRPSLDAVCDHEGAPILLFRTRPKPVRDGFGTGLGRVWTDFPNGSQSAKSKTGGTLVIFAGKVGHVERVYGHEIRLFPIDHRKKIIVWMNFRRG